MTHVLRLIIHLHHFHLLLWLQNPQNDLQIEPLILQFVTLKFQLACFYYLNETILNIQNDGNYGTETPRWILSKVKSTCEMLKEHH